MTAIGIVIIYLIIGAIVAYYDTPDREHRFDLNSQTIAKTLVWPAILYNKYK